jgi:excisionase family DNA binding protein
MSSVAQIGPGSVEAAELLNVSRPHLIKLVASDALPFRMVAAHRLVRVHWSPTMPITEHDRHVLALAVHGDADSIVTFNLRDFPASACEPYGVEAVDPDSFAVAVAESDRRGLRLRCPTTLAGARVRQ